MKWSHRLHLPFVITSRAKARTKSRRRRRQPASAPPSGRIVIPTDLIFTAWRQLFPAERMVVFGGRASRRRVTVTSLSDVTEPTPSAAHVRACPTKLGTALVDMDRAGAHLAIWMHSHPGDGPRATYPSDVDRKQDQDLQRDYSSNLVGIIVVRDGWLRVFGQAIDDQRVYLSWSGKGIEKVQGEEHVYRLKLS